MGPLTGLLPAGVVVVELFTDPPHLDLYPPEAAVLAGAVDKRRREFATVRLCARTALARIGVAPGPILPGPRGAPQWPDGVVGSMTHCPGYRAPSPRPGRRVAQARPCRGQSVGYLLLTPWFTPRAE